MAKKTKTADKAPVAPVEEVVEPTMTDDKDSLGNPKEPEMIGPRGPNVPIGVKPAPESEVLPPVNDVTDRVDSAGNEIAEENLYIPGPKGPDAQRFIRDSYKR